MTEVQDDIVKSFSRGGHWLRKRKIDEADISSNQNVETIRNQNDETTSNHGDVDFDNDDYHVDDETVHDFDSSARSNFSNFMKGCSIFQISNHSTSNNLSDVLHEDVYTNAHVTLNDLCI